MAFVTDAGGNVTSYAEYTDVLQKDQRLLEANVIKVPAESGFVDATDFIEDMLSKSTDRINIKFKASSWYQGYLNYTGQSVSRPALMPDFNPNYVLSRKQEFTDLAVFYCLYYYICPLIADFSADGTGEISGEVQKIKYYEDKFQGLFNELIALADWYDADGDGVIENSEKVWTNQTVRRSRRRSTVVRVN
tara:strand:- start:378 stop:950 length:573 start_codon:yes stop_codon:yes gene_type:complete